MPEFDEVLALEERRRQALLKLDLAALSELLADTLIYVHSSGVRDSKASYLNTLREGRLKYVSLHFSDWQLQALPQGALVNAHMKAQIIKEGQALSVSSQFLTVWACNARGVWQLLAHQGTPLPTP